MNDLLSRVENDVQNLPREKNGSSSEFFPLLNTHMHISKRKSPTLFDLGFAWCYIRLVEPSHKNLFFFFKKKRFTNPTLFNHPFYDRERERDKAPIVCKDGIKSAVRGTGPNISGRPRLTHYPLHCIHLVYFFESVMTTPLNEPPFAKPIKNRTAANTHPEGYQAYMPSRNSFFFRNPTTLCTK